MHFLVCLSLSNSTVVSKMATTYRNNTSRTIRLALLFFSSILFISFIYGVDSQNTDDQLLSSYRVGVVDYLTATFFGFIHTRNKAQEAKRKNIDAYNQTAIEAKSQGVKLLVFPEYGLGFDNGKFSNERKLAKLFAETIPDPKSQKNPCEDAVFENESTDVQRLLSCIAKENEMFLVVNMVGREPCNNESECPPDNEYIYNTNVVFSPKGEVVARYYQTHLFYHGLFDAAKSPEAAIFDTPFGKFATFISFDVLFKRPAIELADKYHIRNIAFSTGLHQMTPIFQSIQVQSAFAREAQVNLLVSNLGLLFDLGSSGIYTPNGVNYRPHTGNSMLIVSDVHHIKDFKPNTKIETDFNISNDNNTKNDTELSWIGTVAELKFKHLKTKSGSVTVCEKSFCCRAYYAIEGPFEETYALGVYNGLLGVAGNKMYTQICTLLKCQNSRCGSEITSVKTVFSNITLQADGVLSKYMYPSLVTMEGDSYELVPNDWTYSDELGLQSLAGKKITLSSATLMSRVFSKDILVGGKWVKEKKEEKNEEETKKGEEVEEKEEKKTQNGQKPLGKNSVIESFEYILYFVAVYVLANF